MIKPLSVRVNEVIGQYINAGRRDEIGNIPAMEFMAPESIDYTHGNYVVMDGVYHTYLLVPSGGYRSQVCAGWISLLVNAGEGIDVDIFFDRQPKDRIQQKLRTTSLGLTAPKSRTPPIPTRTLTTWTALSAPATS